MKNNDLPFMYSGRKVALRVLMALFLAFLLQACGSGTAHTPAADIAAPEELAVEADTASPTLPSGHVFPYDLSKPDGSFVLGNKLTEISGLGLSPDGLHLIAVNDEQGIIFYLNKTNGQVEKEVKFSKAGDYEGIEAVGDQVFLAKANGDIYQVAHPGKDGQQTKLHETALNSGNNVEGLGYDFSNNRLLVACKGQAGIGKDMKNIRAVYGYDLENNTLIEQPVFLIDLEKLKSFATHDPKAQQTIAKPSNIEFAPSGIAIHPKTSDICIVSSVGKLLVVISPEGEIKHIEKLEAKIFKQPEGICFDTDSALFISSEGKGGKGMLFRFDQK